MFEVLVVWSMNDEELFGKSDFVNQVFGMWARLSQK